MTPGQLSEPGAKEYLESRGYNQKLLEEDQPFTLVGEGRTPWDYKLEMDRAVCWMVRSMSGALMGILARELDQSKYRWAQKPGCEHLPIMYGSPRDYELLWKTGRLVITEGQFDRIAMKRLLPEETAVFARLTKGVGKLLLVFIQRYASEVVTVFDNDDPGRDATEKTENKIPGAQSLLLPTKDPSKLLELYGFLKAKDLVKRRWSMLGL